VLGALSKHGTVLYHLGPATGRWKYNGTISLLAGCRPFYWWKGSDGSAADSAIEYKHQNVGAVMIESGFACIRGYKSKGNFQDALSNAASQKDSGPSEAPDWWTDSRPIRALCVSLALNTMCRFGMGKRDSCDGWGT
jgi:hypothetical protein